MALISFKTFRESSPATRNKAAAANGLAPMFSADVFGHATPPPAIADELLKKLNADKPKKSSKKKKKEEEEPVSENKGQKPDYSFDKFVKKATDTVKEIDKDVADGNKKSAVLDKEKTDKEKTVTEKKPKVKTSIPAKKASQAIDPFPFTSKEKEEIPGEKLPSSKNKNDDDDESESEDDDK